MLRLDHSTMKLGKKPIKVDPRTLQFAKYVTAALPPSPAYLDLTGKVKTWGMMKNDTIGDCTIAEAGHQEEVWTSQAKGKEYKPTDKSIIKAYSAISGFDPITGANDNGCALLDVLKYWKKYGIGSSSHKILAYAQLDPKNHAHVMASVYLFGGVYAGVQLPISAQNQIVWDVPPGGPTGHGAPGSWGGHGVPLVGYANLLTTVTWGELKAMTWPFWDTYFDEAYAVLSQDWMEKNNISPEGFNLQQLLADVKLISG